MKKILILILALAAGYNGFAQQTPKAKHMTIMLFNDHAAFTVGKKINNMIITRDDTAQVQKLVDLNPHVKLREEPAAYETLLMNLLKPYYDDGWKLVTSSVEFVQNTNTEVFRYYFVKEE
ncbi:MAG: hypothetical protein JST19_01275 [Bacteroidetes bacterium]|nr:hypothetical protein [Bacteroidota bacterium]